MFCQYKISFNRKVNNTCYHHFSIKTPYSNVTKFLRIYDKYLVLTSPTMKCADRLTHTYLKDIHGKFHLITAQSNVSEIHIHEDQDKEMQYWKTKRIRGYDKRLLKKTQEKLEPHVMLNIFSYVHDMVQEVKTLQEEQGDGNVLLGIGRALGAALEGASVGTSSIIITIRVCIKDS